MLALATKTFRIFLLRWLQGWRYRGNRPGLVATALVLVATSASGALAMVIHDRAHGLTGGPAEMQRAFIGVIVLLLYLIGGPVLLLTESLVVTGGRLRAALCCLPLRRREIGLLVALPVYAAPTLALGLLSVLGVGALTGVGVSIGQAISGAVLASASGFAVAALLIAIVRRVLPGLAAIRLEYPVAIVLWIAALVVQNTASQSLFQGGNPSLGDRLLLTPWLAWAAMNASTGVSQGLVVCCLVVVALACLAVSLQTTPAHARASVMWRWRCAAPLPLVRLELTRMLRSRALMANFAGVWVVGAALLAAVAKAPEDLRASVADLVLPAVVLTGVVPVLLVRGGTLVERPTALVLGYSPARWALTQVSAASVIATATVLPVVACLAGLYMQPVRALGDGGSYLITAFGVVVALAWMWPARPDNPLGQVVTALLAFVGLSAVLWAADRLLGSGSPAWYVAMVLTGALGCVAAPAIEVHRWSRRIAAEQRDVWSPLVRRLPSRRIATVLWFGVVAFLFLGFVHVSQRVQGSPGDAHVRLEFVTVPLFDGFKRSGRIGVHPEWGVLLASIGPILVSMIWHMMQIRRLLAHESGG